MGSEILFWNDFGVICSWNRELLAESMYAVYEAFGDKDLNLAST